MEINPDSLLILAIHILLYVAVLFDVPILRQCIGFVYLTFIPGFVIIRAIGARYRSLTVDIFLSVNLSIAFVMFVGLLANTVVPLFDISSPLSSLPLLIVLSIVTLTIFGVSQIRTVKRNPINYFQLSNFKINVKGFFLCFVSVLLLIFSIIGSLYDSVPLLLFVIAGSAAVFATSFFLNKHISSEYLAIILFLISLSLLLQTALISKHIMGWDVFGEYAAYVSVSRVGIWIPAGISSTFNTASILNSILSVTILPTVYSTILNLNGEIVFKVIFPIIFCFVPLGLFKIYESQLGKVIALLSVFFFIADPLNLYGLGPLSLTREMITYLFLSAIIFCFVYKDLDKFFSNRTRRVLIIAFSAGLAVSHYSLAFIYAFFLVFIYMALRIRGKKSLLLDLPMLLLVLSIVFGWYMFISSPPLNKLVDDLSRIASNFVQDFFSSGSRFDPGMSTISPLSRTTNIFNLMHKLVIYVSEFFVVVGVAVLVIKPKEFKLNREFSLMSIFAALLLIVLLVVPNLAPTLNFTRFYRFTMVFLAPMFVLGGIYFLGLTKKLVSLTNKIVSFFRIRHRFSLKGRRLIILVSFLMIFILFRSSFVNTIANGRPDSFSLQFNKMKTMSVAQTNYESSLYDVYFTESDLSGERWLGSNINNVSLVYVDFGMGAQTLTGYGHLNYSQINYISNYLTQGKPGFYFYLRSLNVLEGVVTDPDAGVGYFNLVDISPSLSQDDQVYSNGANNVYYVP
jgi:uncharacterized membrane protein